MPESVVERLFATTDSGISFPLGITSPLDRLNSHPYRVVPMEITALHLPGLLLALEQLAKVGIPRSHIAHTSLMDLIGNAEEAWGQHVAGVCSSNPVTLVLVQAERFVAGFDGDELKNGVARLLADLRGSAFVAEQWRTFIGQCAGQAGGLVNGNHLSLRAAALLALPGCPEVGKHG